MLYPDVSLAKLYDPGKMPDDLKAAHAALDAAVEAAYGVAFNCDEAKSLHTCSSSTHNRLA